MLELRHDEIALFASADDIDEVLQAGAAQAVMVQALREHPGEEQRIITNVLAHLALVIKRRSGTVDRVGFQQHFSHIAERPSIGIPDPVQGFSLAELSQKVGDIALDLSTAQPDL